MMDNKTGTAVGLFFITMGIAQAIAWLFVDFFVDVTFGFPITFILLGIIILMVFKDDWQEGKDVHNKVLDNTKKEEVRPISQKSYDKKKSEEFEKKLMELFNTDLPED